MAGDRDSEKDLGRGAHTAQLPTGEDLAASVAGLVAGLAAGADQSDLFADEPQETLPIEAAEQAATAQRARGRPKGATNRRNADLFDYLAARGFRDPAMTLAAIQSTSAADLAKELGCKKKEALDLIIRAARELMPYAYSRKPLAVEVERRNLHLFLAGDMRAGTPDDGTLSITGQPIENIEETETI